jgi:sugar O-acyltransferase (sialic acid O-acetyltransferase NeuD family)
MNKPLIIVGAGNFASIVEIYFNEFYEKEIVAFAVSQKLIDKSSFQNRSIVILENIQNDFPPSKFDIFVAIGYKKMNRIRESIYSDLLKMGYNLISFIHPEVKIWKSTNIGKNCFIFENNVIQPFTKIGNNSILWSGNHIGHHSEIGDNVFVSSHVVISGNCKIGDNSFIGVNSCFHDGVQVGKFALVGAGSIISKDVLDKAVYAPDVTKPHSVNTDRLNF